MGDWYETGSRRRRTMTSDNLVQVLRPRIPPGQGDRRTLTEVSLEVLECGCIKEWYEDIGVITEIASQCFWHNPPYLIQEEP